MSDRQHFLTHLSRPYRLLKTENTRENAAMGTPKQIAVHGASSAARGRCRRRTASALLRENLPGLLLRGRVGFFVNRAVETQISVRKRQIKQRAVMRRLLRILARLEVDAGHAHPVGRDVALHLQLANHLE